MTKKAVTVSTVIILLAAAGTAQTQQGTSVGPGFIAPDSPLYGLEVAFDNAQTAVGLKQAGTVAQERVAEAEAMVQQNKTDATTRALAQLNNTIAEAPPEQAAGLEIARNQLERLVRSTPDAANFGLNTALDQVTKAAARKDAQREIQRLRELGSDEAADRAMDLEKRLQSMQTVRDAEQLQDKVGGIRDEFTPDVASGKQPDNGNSGGGGGSPIPGY